MKFRSLVLGTMALPLALILPNTAWAAKSPSSFTVTAVNSNYEASSTSPLVLYDSGGYVNVEGDDPNSGGHCRATISSKPALHGLPVGASCGTPLTANVNIPANSGTSPVSYTFTLRPKRPKAEHIVVIVSTSPPPSSVPGVVPGSTWEAAGASCPSPIPPVLQELLGWPPSTIVETYNADGAVSGSYPGSYTVEGDQLAVDLLVYQGVSTRFFPIYIEFGFTLTPSGQDYTGTDSFGCSWTLTPQEN